jgi:hypothetical protein
MIEYFPVCINSIGMELTRNCGLRCKMCMRGEPQNVVMSDDVKKAVLTKFRPHTIYINGGETMRNPEQIEKLKKCLLKTGSLNLYFATPSVQRVKLTLTGGEYNKDFFDALADLDSTIKEKVYQNKFQKTVHINFSNDIEHARQLLSRGITREDRVENVALIKQKYPQFNLDIEEYHGANGRKHDLWEIGRESREWPILRVGRAKKLNALQLFAMKAHFDERTEESISSSALCVHEFEKFYRDGPSSILIHDKNHGGHLCATINAYGALVHKFSPYTDKGVGNVLDKNFKDVLNNLRSNARDDDCL